MSKQIDMFIYQSGIAPFSRVYMSMPQGGFLNEYKIRKSILSNVFENPFEKPKDKIHKY